MRKLKLYIAVSLDGKIASKDGSVDWLEKIPNPDQSDYDYQSFFETVDITLMGHSTYKSVDLQEHGDVYPGKENYVFTRDASIPSTEYFSFISQDPVEFIKPRLSEEGGDVWLIGGAQLNSLFFKAGMVDEIRMHIMPVALGEGIDLLSEEIPFQLYKLEGTKSYASGTVMLSYTKA